MTRQAILLLTLAFLLTGCVGLPWPQSNGTTVDSVAVEIWVSNHSVQVGQPLQIRFTARNQGRQTVVFDAKTRPVLDVVVGGVKDKAYVWSEGKELNPNLTRLELKPGEQKTIEVTWTPGEEYEGVVANVTGFIQYGPEQWQMNETGVAVSVGFVPSPL